MDGRVPQLHILYRAADGESVTSQLAAHLRTVIGTHSVAVEPAAGRDPADGPVLTSDDVVLVVVGPTWTELSADGDGGAVARVEAALATPAGVIPVLVDGAELPTKLPPTVSGLGELEPARLRTSVADHDRDLVALESRIWRQWMSAAEPSLVVMRVDGQPVSAGEFVGALERSHDGAIRTLGLAASGMVALTAEDAREQTPALAIVLADVEEPSESTRERLRAALAARRWGRLVIVGTGSIPGWVSGKGFDATLLPALGWLRDLAGSSGVAVETVSAASSAPAAVAEAIGGALEGFGGAATQTTGWVSSLLGWKGAVAAVGVVGVTAGVVAVATSEDDESPAAAAVVSTFDAGTQGWTVWGDAQGGSAVPTFRSDAGAPPGSIEANDNTVGGTWYWRAPSLYHGVDAADGLVLQFDLRHEGSGSLYEACDVMVVSGDRGACLADGVEPDGTFNTNTVTFTNGTEQWHRVEVADGLPAGVVPGERITQADLREIISSIDELLIRGEYINGRDSGGLDNVSFGPGT